MANPFNWSYIGFKLPAALRWSARLAPTTMPHFSPFVLTSSRMQPSAHFTCSCAALCTDACLLCGVAGASQRSAVVAALAVRVLFMCTHVHNIHTYIHTRTTISSKDKRSNHYRVRSLFVCAYIAEVTSFLMYNARNMQQHSALYRCPSFMLHRAREPRGCVGSLHRSGFYVHLYCMYACIVRMFVFALRAAHDQSTFIASLCIVMFVYVEEA